MKALFSICAAVSLLGLSACRSTGETAAAGEASAASRTAPKACPLPREWQRALGGSTDMQWRRAQRDGTFTTEALAAEKAALVKDLLLYRTRAAQARNGKAPSRRCEERLHLQLRDTAGKTACSIPMCYIAPTSDARGGVFQYSRYSMSDTDYATLYRLMLPLGVSAEAPQGKAPDRQELIRRYNYGGDVYDAQTHVITYRLVSGKEIWAERSRHPAPRPEDPLIAPEHTYGIARVIKPRNEPVLGGGNLQVVYDPETGAILCGGKAR